MTTAIVKREITPDIWNMIQQIAPVMQKSRLFGVATQEQAASIMLKGAELGLSMTASFEFIQVIADKPTLSPRGALALIIQSGECEGLKITDEVDDKGTPTACTVWMKRKKGFEYTARFTMEDAKRADLIKSGGGWIKYPANMLRYRSIGFCADIVFPDLLGGMKRADELGADLTPDGDVINTTWSVVEQKKVEPPTPSQATVALNDLIAQYGADKILAVNKGQIPTSLQDLIAVAAKLRDAESAALNSVSLDSVVELKS